MRRGTSFQVAIEALVPESKRRGSYDTIRYEVEIGVPDAGELGIQSETVRLKRSEERSPTQRDLFPSATPPPVSILEQKGKPGTQVVATKNPEGNDNFYSEDRSGGGKGWIPTFRLGPRRSALANLPEDESKFPAATWLKTLLAEGAENIVLESLTMRRASPPGQPRAFKSDGSNLPWVIEGLKKSDPTRYADWVAHLQTALPDLVDIDTVEREDDRHRYLMLRYSNGLRIPSWTASDGTLRLLALTLLAYLKNVTGIYLIEEPENGIHPRAVETAFQSLSNVYGAQLLLATHSPVIVSLVSPSEILCFAKGEEGATDIVRGDEHPILSEWKGETNLSTLFAGGVLG
jgi:hypothetical protein